MPYLQVLAARYSPPLFGEGGLVSAIWVEGEAAGEVYRHTVCLRVIEGCLAGDLADENSLIRSIPLAVLEHLVLCLPDAEEEDEEEDNGEVV